jgi:hypothetical protein
VGYYTFLTFKYANLHLHLHIQAKLNLAFGQLEFMISALLHFENRGHAGFIEKGNDFIMMTMLVEERKHD